MSIADDHRAVSTLLRDSLPSGEDALEVIRFSSGGEEFALPLREVHEVLDAPAIFALPDAPSGVRGVIPFGDQMVVVWGGDDFLGVAGSAPGESVLLMRSEHGLLGLAVDALGQPRSVSGSTLRRVPALEDQSGALAAVYMEEGVLVALLDPTAFRESAARGDFVTSDPSRRGASGAASARGEGEVHALTTQELRR